MAATQTGYPVWVANDAMLGALAEFDFGAGRGRRSLVYLNGGTSGIGGGVIIEGTLLKGRAGYAGEFGHVRVSSSPARDSAGFSGTLEAEVTREELCSVLGLGRPGPQEFASALLADRSTKVREVVRRQLNYLGTAIAAAINVLTLPPSLEGVTITAAELGENLLSVGAAGLAFTDLLADPTIVRQDMAVAST
ncbi:MAG TPA: ROK family protein [Propionicimonas sp.]|nr:ROK family protein [Propionicimonas sp.]HQD95804.1 ROK family protein [Propionicimonas sp.]